MDIEERVRRLEDREAIKELRARYCYLADAGEWKAWSGLFTDDAQGIFEGFGTADGREGFLKYGIEVVAAQFPFLKHMVHNEIIEVDGDSATGKWYFDVPCVSAPDSPAFGGGKDGWLQGTYDEKYRREGSEWKICQLTASFQFVAGLREGWKDQV